MQKLQLQLKMSCIAYKFTFCCLQAICGQISVCEDIFLEEPKSDVCTLHYEYHAAMTMSLDELVIAETPAGYKTVNSGLS